LRAAVGGALGREEAMRLVLWEAFHDVIMGCETMGVLIHELSVETA
jgi:hypothetical protein